MFIELSFVGRDASRPDATGWREAVARAPAYRGSVTSFITGLRLLFASGGVAFRTVGNCSSERRFSAYCPAE
jgi:hypothetical protein